MHIDELDVAAYTVPTDAPEGDGTLTWDSTTLVLVRVWSGGTVGIGWTYGPRACTDVVRDQLAPVVTGRDVFDVVSCWQDMVRATRNSSRPGIVGYAISAVDVALWDLKAAVLQVPLHGLLGRAEPDVAVYGSGGFTTYDDRRLTGQLTNWLSEGHSRVKIKIGESWGRNTERDLARIRRAREIVGDGVELYVDANGGYSRKQAIRMGRTAAEHGVIWFEEPVSSDDLDGLREVRNAVTADVTAGEYGSDLYYFRRMCGAEAVDCLQVDATRCGGITEWQRAAAVAASYGLDVSAHCAPHVHVAIGCGTPNVRHLEWFHDHVRIENMFFDGTLRPHAGRVRPTGDEPGLGLRFRASDAEKYRVA